MQPSANRHVLAILRRVLGGIEQHRLAKLVECSVETIRKIEKGQLKLSESLAMRVHEATGVSVAWLLENDLTKPPVDLRGNAFTKDRYEQWVVSKEGRGIIEGEELDCLFGFYEAMRHGLFTARKEGKNQLALYRLTELLEKFREEFDAEAPQVGFYWSSDIFDLVKADWDDATALQRVEDGSKEEKAILARMRKRLSKRRWF